MNRHFNPDGIAAPVSTYSHAVEVAPSARWLVVSGQIGVDSEGTLATDVISQSEWVWCNIRAILEDAGMTTSDIVKMTAYLLSPDDVASYGAVRNSVLGDHRPASTLIYVSALATPEVLVEVEVTAARGA